ncbi:MOSC domain-containing protein [Diplocarpon rosae]|nr:MOSC domain-containing protein [Diplocarpon rosae]
MAPVLAPRSEHGLEPDASWHTETEIVQQLRTSKMKRMRDLSIMTGIYKEARSERLWCSLLGLQGDEHDLTFHGGVHQYCPQHYSLWVAEYPDEADAFVPGAFGENVVSERMHEGNVCIGDVVRIGGVLLQVSLPRQPCFKLNHRFGIKGFASESRFFLPWSSRTGCRDIFFCWVWMVIVVLEEEILADDVISVEEKPVLVEGWMGVGDGITLVERKWPAWTIERLSQIDAFGAECKKAFKRMIAVLKATEAEKSKPKEVFEKYKLVEKTVQTPRITSFTFAKPGEGKAIGTQSKQTSRFLKSKSSLLPRETLLIYGNQDPGSFVRLQLPNGLLRSYSIVSGNTHRFQVGIALDDQSRGGSKFLHQDLHLGDALLAGHITPSVPKTGDASNHIFLVGGIGITAFLALIERFQAINYNYTLHYAVRSREEIPYRKAVAGMGKNCVVYAKDEGRRMDIERILRKRAWNSMVYICGPTRMIAAVEEAATALGIEDGEVHYEAFQENYTGDPFEIEVVGGAASSGKKETRAVVLDVPGDKTLLSVLREAGLEIDSSCEVGNCGACTVMVKKGAVEHRGRALSAEEKAEGAMLACPRMVFREIAERV